MSTMSNFLASKNFELKVDLKQDTPSKDKGGAPAKGKAEPPKPAGKPGAVAEKEKIAAEDSKDEFE